MKFSKLVRSALVLFAVWSSVSSCYYYKAVSMETDVTDQTKFLNRLTQLEDTTRYVVIHSTNGTWHLKNIQLRQPEGDHSHSDTQGGYLSQNTTVTGHIEAVDSIYLRYATKIDKHQTPRYVHKNLRYATTQTHLYVSSTEGNGTTEMSFAVSSIYKIDVYKQDCSLTTISWTFSGMGISIAVMAALIIGVGSSGTGMNFGGGGTMMF